MKVKTALMGAVALLFCAGTTYGEQTDIFGGFSIAAGNYTYVATTQSIGAQSPSCPCDSFSSSFDCGVFFYSATDLGPKCYDVMYSTSYEFDRSDTKKTFAVTPDGRIEVNTLSRVDIKSGEIAVLTSGSGIILKANNGSNCYRLTVNNTGTLQTALISCP